ncbi:fatty acyl-CoA synthetase [Dactylosporangium sp. AC04546]|uniref:fatty acyl-CoA synthetase n=1 Tax=Dactylosporangium sp. AC04546 TaxID=2862460 RepID=UPI001EDFDC98|nr:fatty acyl-CoA synthetase [Dactylosporangium sp. AC04546]WVK86845.1 fatty acyl-CoA synthetase [Dactylosporangium sp. AC04546]
MSTEDVHDEVAEAIARARTQQVGDIPRRSARRVGTKTALVDGATRLSFAEFDATIDRVCAAWAADGLVKGDRVAIVSRNCWQFPVLSFAAARSGLVFVPINFMLKADEVAYILDHSEAAALVVGPGLTDVAEQALARTTHHVPRRAGIGGSVAGHPASWADVEEWMSWAADGFSAPRLDDDEPIRLMYTSGTESRPKGVLLGSRSLMWQYMSCISTGGMETDDVEIHSLPLYHCAQMDNFLSTDVYLGATSIILPGPDPREVLRLIELERATNYFAPPTVWISLLACEDFATRDLTSLRKGYYGAAAMPPEVFREMDERLPNVRFWNFYGQTELASLATALGPEDQRTRPGSAGRAALNVEIAIVDDEGRELPAGEVGEIVHRSPQITLGYYRDPEKTSEAFSGGWFHSGDLGVLDEDGYLRVVDRKKDVIKTGGENVSSREVEDVLYEVDGVREAAVFGVPDPRWVEAVVAAVVPTGDGAVDEDHVIAYARSRLAGFKAPKRVVFVDTLPKNPSGKILKRQLRDEFAGLMTEAS